MSATESNTDSCRRLQVASVLSMRAKFIGIELTDILFAVTELWWRKSCLTGAAPIHLWTSCLGIPRCDSSCDAMA
jgi:hypothetical protein